MVQRKDIVQPAHGIKFMKIKWISNTKKIDRLIDIACQRYSALHSFPFLLLLFITLRASPVHVLSPGGASLFETLN